MLGLASVVISISNTAEVNARTEDLLEPIGLKRRKFSGSPEFKVPRHVEGQ
jgi:hypothetical protein